MTKNDFLLKLREHTCKEEGERLYLYYSEIIEDRIEAGENEEAIIASFGDIGKIIQEAEASRKVRDFEEKPRLSTGFKALTAVLLVFASPIMLAVLLPLVVTAFVLVIVLLVTLLVSTIAFLATGIAGLIAIMVGVSLLFSTPLVGLFQIGTGFVALGLGVVFSYLLLKLTKLCLGGVKNLCTALINKFMKKNERGGDDV